MGVLKHGRCCSIWQELQGPHALSLGRVKKKQHGFGVLPGFESKPLQLLFLFFLFSKLLNLSDLFSSYKMKICYTAPIKFKRDKRHEVLDTH